MKEDGSIECDITFIYHCTLVFFARKSVFA